MRLSAPDGYTAQRSYSVASPPGDGSSIDLTVERLPDGEVSTFLHDELQVGDTLEVRGPIGGWFVWDGSDPALLIGGGSGVVPLMAMLRLARRQPQQSLAHLLVSAREPADLIYAGELGGDDATVLFTRAALPDSARVPGRITADDLRPHVRSDATVYICGSAGFAATATTWPSSLDSTLARFESNASAQPVRPRAEGAPQASILRPLSARRVCSEVVMRPRWFADRFPWRTSSNARTASTSSHTTASTR